MSAFKASAQALEVLNLPLVEGVDAPALTLSEASAKPVPTMVLQPR